MSDRIRISEKISWEEREDGFSITARPDCAAGEARCLAVAAATWVLEAVGNGAEILWPNHVVLEGRRVCGITCRASEGAVVFAFQPELSAVPVSPEAFRTGVLEAASAALESYPANRPELMQRYCEHCLTVMKHVNVTYRGMPVYGFAFAVDRHGGLMVMTQESRTVITLYGGEAEIAEREERTGGIPEPLVTPDR